MKKKKKKNEKNPKTKRGRRLAGVGAMESMGVAGSGDSTFHQPRVVFWLRSTGSLNTARFERSLKCWKRQDSLK